MTTFANKESNYPAGFAGGVTIQGMPILNTYGGNVFWVDSATGADVGQGKGTFQKPFDTIDYAVGRCTANNGDVILVKPGHTETITAAAGIDLDVAGITVCGLGSGADQPTITFTTATTADIDVDAANITVKNIRFVGNIDALAAPIDVNSDSFTMDGCRFTDSGTTNVLRWIQTVAGVDNLVVVNCINEGTATAGNAAWISLVAGDHHIISGNVSEGDFSVANVAVETTAVTDCLISDNFFENANAVDVCIEGLAAATGWIARNCLRIATDGQTTWINTVGALQLFENYGVNNDGETGKLCGTASV